MENIHMYVQRLFGSLYSYFNIPLQMKKGRYILVETSDIPHGYTFDRITENSIYSFQVGNMTIYLSSAGEIFADLYLAEEGITISSCICQLSDVTMLRANNANTHIFMPLCDTWEFVAFCTLLYNCFASERIDNLASHISSQIHLVVNTPYVNDRRDSSGTGRRIDELSSFEKMLSFDWRKLEYIRQGAEKELTKLIRSEKYVQISQAYFGSLSVVYEAFEYTLPIMVRFVGEAGGDVEKAWSMYNKYKKAARSADSINEGVKMYDEMMLDFCRIIADAAKNKYSPKIQKVRLYIHSNWKDNISIDRLCEMFDISRAYLMKLFKKETGKTIVEYITDIRMNYVQYMLVYTREPISHIAAEAGFSTQSYMTSVFRSRYGMTPLEYQKKAYQSNLHIRR